MRIWVWEIASKLKVRLYLTGQIKQFPNQSHLSDVSLWENAHRK